MTASYLPYEPQQQRLLPDALQDWLPEGHLAYFISDSVDSVDFHRILTRWVSSGWKSTVNRDEALMERIQSAWEGFTPFLDKDTPPHLSDRDTRHREDHAWSDAASAYVQLKKQADALAQELEAARQALVALVQHPKEHAAGVTVTQFWKQGPVD